ncbi:MFS transporter [Rhizorhabdus dicambivorans]|uniref:MFS transporter n=1 Tax=Rhizorhabdus dicambivorans TaxID=1850238 RepID=UPI0008312C7E|nr:MFS transporter [Rhizorhabdus dicambivorans]
MNKADVEQVQKLENCDPPYPSSSAVGYTVGVLTIGFVVAYLDRQVISILLEPIRLSLGLTDTQLSLVQGFAFSLFFVLAGIPIGRLVDRANRRNVLIGGLICWTAATFACGLAQNFWQLFLARMLVGIGEACLAPTGYSIVADIVRPGRRGLAMGFLTGGTAVGAAGSIFIGGLLLEMFAEGLHIAPLGHVASWQIVFFLVSLPGVPLILMLFTVAEPARREKVAIGPSDATFVQFVRRHPAGFGLTFAAFASNLICGIATMVWIPVVLMRIYKVPAVELGATIGALMLVVGGLASTIGGAAGDWLQTRAPSIGRLGVPLLAFPLLILLALFWYFVEGATPTIIYYGLSCGLVGSIINGSSFSAINQMVPNNMRGQAVTAFLVVGNFAGLGLAPTAVALVTDYVLKDPMQVQLSVILVAIPAQMTGLLLTLLALKPYRRTCEAAAAMTQASTAMVGSTKPI